MTAKAKKPLRTGYTTGTAATAAAKAATLVLRREHVGDTVAVTLPDGSEAQLPVTVEHLHDGARATVIKDGGDDPDVTTGAAIVATVRLTDDDTVTIKGGEGVGTVTLKGLKVPVGEAAINPVPRQMIRKHVKAALPPEHGAEVTISVPDGEKLAKKTFNPKLGIVGGISILGSTGIVHPMSEDALTESLALELNVLREKGRDKAIFAFGNYGLDFLRAQHIGDDAIVKISNYLGFSLDKAVDLSFREILLVGHLGKLVKVAGGIFQTHSRRADARMEILTAFAGLEGASPEVMEAIYRCRTTSAAAAIIAEQQLEPVYRRIVAAVNQRCVAYTRDELAFGVMLFGDDNVLLAADEASERLRKELSVSCP